MNICTRVQEPDSVLGISAPWRVGEQTCVCPVLFNTIHNRRHWKSHRNRLLFCLQNAVREEKTTTYKLSNFFFVRNLIVFLYCLILCSGTCKNDQLFDSCFLNCVRKLNYASAPRKYVDKTHVNTLIHSVKNVISKNCEISFCTDWRLDLRIKHLSICC